MYKTIKRWMTGTVTIKPFTGLNASADKTYGAASQIKCLWVGEAAVIANAAGVDVTSNSRFYFDPSDYSVGINDKVLVDGIEKDIIEIANYMDGNTGSSSIKVVYV